MDTGQKKITKNTDKSKAESDFSRQHSLKTIVSFSSFLLLSFSTSNGKYNFVQ